MNTPTSVQVLLVEDSPTDALIIGEALIDIREFEHKLTHAESLADALAHAQEMRFDVVLLDLGLPDGNGIETFRRFRHVAPDTPVLVLTGLSDISVGLIAIQEGAQDYLLKREIQAALLSRAIRYAIERNRALTALAASEERFQLAVGGASAGLWDWNLRTGQMYLSPHFREIVGHDEDELPNEMRAHYEIIHRDDVEQVMLALRAHTEDQHPYDIEYRVRTRAGEYRWIQSRAQALWDASGTAYRMVGWIMDVTDRRRAAEALRESREELQRLSANIQHIREEEKTRIARELHDDLGQLLTALKIDMIRFEEAIAGKIDQSSAGALRNIYGLIDQLVGSVRRIAADLRPVMLDDLGPIPAIDWFIHEFSARHGITVNAQLDVNEVTFNRDSGTEVFRMVQEGLTNVARHSGASEANIEIARDEPFCVVKISDNGRGALPSARRSRKSFGLLGMRERAARLGGELDVATAPGEGFALTVTLPLAVVEAPDADDAGGGAVAKH
ncbi:PAS domain-containing protein [Trinickia dinghuensis]|uniref:Response regulator n=1 Tax=Trinickia dinghuensis TaxID=2291023 RepID=A0A3D8JUB0_9BURK|nr:PAS domain-containing protein [Trinickia dinghuensis]RDU96315.1 response regulator [Trinickia dinghuensis]